MIRMMNLRLRNLVGLRRLQPINCKRWFAPYNEYGCPSMSYYIVGYKRERRMATRRFWRDQSFIGLLLNERVRVYRWSAVAIGFLGVLVMLAPHLDASRISGHTPAETVGAMLALTSAFCNAGAVIQTRRLVDTETTSSIVFYFSLSCAVAGAVTLPFDWVTPNGWQLAALIGTGVIGGLSHILLTESYRYAPASLVAPFDYTSILWAFILGYAMFGEVPAPLVFTGAGIVVATGLFVLWRERQLGLRRKREVEGATTRM